MLPFQKFKSQSKDQALSLLDKSVATVDEMQSLFADLFPYEKLSDASSSFIKSATTGNDKVVTAVTTTLDMVQSVSQTARTLEYFIQLHIPAIEDGGNFGVSIPLGEFFVVPSRKLNFVIPFPCLNRYDPIIGIDPAGLLEEAHRNPRYAFEADRRTMWIRQCPLGGFGENKFSFIGLVSD